MLNYISWRGENKDNKGDDKITHSKPLLFHCPEVILHEPFQCSSVKAKLAYINLFQNQPWFSTPQTVFPRMVAKVHMDMLSQGLLWLSGMFGTFYPNCRGIFAKPCNPTQSWISANLRMEPHLEVFHEARFCYTWGQWDWDKYSFMWQQQMSGRFFLVSLLYVIL